METLDESVTVPSVHSVRTAGDNEPPEESKRTNVFPKMAKCSFNLASFSHKQVEPLNHQVPFLVRVSPKVLSHMWETSYSWFLQKDKTQVRQLDVFSAFGFR